MFFGRSIDRCVYVQAIAANGRGATARTRALRAEKSANDRVVSRGHPQLGMYPSGRHVCFWVRMDSYTGLKLAGSRQSEGRKYFSLPIKLRPLPRLADELEQARGR